MKSTLAHLAEESLQSVAVRVRALSGRDLHGNLCPEERCPMSPVRADRRHPTQQGTERTRDAGSGIPSSAAGTLALSQDWEYPAPGSGPSASSTFTCIPLPRDCLIPLDSHWLFYTHWVCSWQVADCDVQPP